MLLLFMFLLSFLFFSLYFAQSSSGGISRRNVVKASSRSGFILHRLTIKSFVGHRLKK